MGKEVCRALAMPGGSAGKDACWEPLLSTVELERPGEVSMGPSPPAAGNRLKPGGPCRPAAGATAAAAAAWACAMAQGGRCGVAAGEGLRNDGMQLGSDRGTLSGAPGVASALGMTRSSGLIAAKACGVCL